MTARSLKRLLIAIVVFLIAAAAVKFLAGSLAQSLKTLHGGGGH
jgi:hypothetical protein